MTHVLGSDAMGDISALCRRSIWGAPSEDELRRALFPPDQAVTVLGDPASGVAAVVRDGDRGYVRLLVVAPDRRRAGLGRELLAAAEQALAGTASVEIGGDPVHGLWPGVPATDIALVCLLEAAGYRREGVDVTMEVDLKSPLPSDPGGWEVAEAAHLASVCALAESGGARAADLVRRALEADSLVVVRDGKQVVAACAVDVNRAGTLGPLVAASGPSARIALVGALRLMRQRSHPRAEIPSVHAMAPYAAVGAKVARFHLRYAKATSGS